MCIWAYTNELELEVAHLQAENARLRRQQEQSNDFEWYDSDTSVMFVCVRVCAVKNGGSKSKTQKEHTSTVFHSSILRNLQVLVSLLGIESL
ncbi:unnamed protein product [Thlaspi arvense]|uniref:Uncharacterized protein n=1 Tax=Thlaspi arvense TaxID=13288 RepID=A0AAU9T253_THLAR|nr:unnamed protein product [Thlaspi arvense]